MRNTRTEKSVRVFFYSKTCRKTCENGMETANNLCQIAGILRKSEKSGTILASWYFTFCYKNIIL